MATVTLTPLDSKISYTMAFENNNTHLRDVSFSSYLSNAEETFIRELAESTRNLSSAINTPQELLNQITIGRKKTKDGEISVFGAEKYFNSKMDEEKPNIAEKEEKEHQNNREDSVNLHHMKPKFKMGTPSASSEASYNSQSALVRSFVKNPSPRRQNKVHGKRCFPNFGFKCSCSDKKSVDIDEELGKNKNSGNCEKNRDFGEIHSREIAEKALEIYQNSLNLAGNRQIRPESWFKEEILSSKLNRGGIRLSRDECFTFPILNSEVGNLAIKRKIEEEIARKSLEVFGSSLLEHKETALNLERNLPMLTWDPNPRAEVISATSGTGEINDDTESDSSSDLFEIESLAGTGHPSFNQPETDTMSSCVSPTCYAPSEASIEWSVATASAVNFSAASDYGDQLPELGFPATTTKKNITGKELQRRSSGISLGCKSQKAVKVANDAYRVSEKVKRNPQRPPSLDLFPAMARYHGETKVTEFKSPHVQRAFGTPSPSMSRTQFTRASPPIYMH